MDLKLIPQNLAITRLDPSEPIPNWAYQGQFFSVTRTQDELSIVCSDELVPAEHLSQGPFVAFEVQGPLDFSLVGILSSLTTPLAENGISIFAISTYETDYLLVRQEDQVLANQVLREMGHTIAE